MNRRLAYAILVSIVAIFAVAVIYEFSQPAVVYGSRIEPPKPMPDFTLQSEKGPVHLSDYRGKYVALYFGYTSCPDICPTTLAGLKAALSEIGDQAAGRVQVIFVSVDYKRDTPAKVSTYAHAFSQNFAGLGGTQAQIDQVTHAYGIYYHLNDPDPTTGYYSVDHTAIILLIDPQGQLVMTWDYGQQPDEIASDLKLVLKQ